MANKAGSSEDRRKSRFDRNGIGAADGSVVLCAVAKAIREVGQKGIDVLWLCLNEKKLCKGPKGGWNEWHHLEPEVKQQGWGRNIFICMFHPHSP